MAKFCGKCGARLDEATGLCPKCDADAIMRLRKDEDPAGSGAEAQHCPPEAPKSKKELRGERRAAKKAARKAEKQKRKAQRKAEKKARKKARWAAKSFGQKVLSVFLRLIAWLMAAALLAAAIAVALTWFGLVDIPAVSAVISRWIPPERIHSSESTLYVPDEDALTVDEESGTVYINNIVLIFFHEGTSEKEVHDTIASVNGEVVGSIPIIDQYQVKIEARTLEELNQLCAELKKRDCVMDAVYDAAFEVDSDAIPDDPWGKTWFSKEETWSEANPDGANWWVEAVDAVSAWNYNSKFDTIRIGIVDNGFDTGHEDLKNVIVSTSPINNKAEHGTHVAGIIGAEANNGKGITGLVWNCELYTYDWQLNLSQKIVDSIFDMQWSTFNQILGGTVTLVEQGARVVNLSVGQTGSMSGTTRSDEAVDYNGHYASLYLYSLLERGYDFVIVQSAGNGNENKVSVDAKYNGFFCSITEDNCVTGDDINYEDIAGRVIVVGAAQNDGSGRYSQTYWSNAGSRVDICAPGKDVYSTVPGGFSGRYKNMSGTSMAAPIVTGVASLVWSANPDLNGLQVKQIVCDEKNTENAVADNSTEKHPLTNSYRLVNAKLAVEAAMKASPADDTSDSPADDASDAPGVSGDKQEHVRVTSDERDIVLVLDVSGSMGGTPLEETKKAATAFIETVLREDASIGIVTYADDAEQVSDFSVNGQALTSAISSIYDSGWTNIDAGLSMARSMLDSSGAKKKIIVLMSDGIPNEGREGDSLIAYADEIKGDGILIYTLGFFEDLGSEKSSAQYLMERLASDGCHYEVANAEDLVFFFGDMADQINGTRYIYVRIACPVDVSVSYNGETLDSAEGTLNQRTDFGTLTFEKNENASANTDDRIKVLRLKEGVDYDIQIVGTGRGLMDYTIGFMNEDGEYSDLREFENIKITKTTVIDTVAAVSDETILKVDEDGDGRYDIRYRAEENGRGEEVKSYFLLYVGIGLGAVALIVLILLVRKASQKNKERGR